MNQELHEEKLKALATEIANIRKIKGKSCRLPAEIWESATSLCGGYCIKIISIRLGVSKAQLWHKVKEGRTHQIQAQAAVEHNSKQNRNSFLEVKMIAPPLMSTPLSSSTTSHPVETQIEIVHQNGTRLKIQHPQAHGISIVDLIRSFSCGV